MKENMDNIVNLFNWFFETDLSFLQIKQKLKLYYQIKEYEKLTLYLDLLKENNLITKYKLMYSLIYNGFEKTFFDLDEKELKNFKDIILFMKKIQTAFYVEDIIYRNF